MKPGRRKLGKTDFSVTNLPAEVVVVTRTRVAVAVAATSVEIVNLQFNLARNPKPQRALSRIDHLFADTSIN